MRANDWVNAAPITASSGDIVQWCDDHAGYATGFSGAARKVAGMAYTLAYNDMVRAGYDRAPLAARLDAEAAKLPAAERAAVLAILG